MMQVLLNMLNKAQDGFVVAEDTDEGVKDSVWDNVGELNRPAKAHPDQYYSVEMNDRDFIETSLM